ncbi:MAG: mechanosensitive ion channel [Flavobacteriales bacterium]|nr:mechanosensitive ion channel [Flavobacteriales bacterium]
MDLSLLQASLMQAFQTYLSGIVASLPAVLSGLIVLLIGWVIAKLLRAIVARIVRTAGVDAIAERAGLNAVLGKLGGLTVSKFICGLVYMLTLFIFIVAAADIMHLTGVTNAFNSFFGYLPTLLTALVIFVGGLWGAEKVKDAVSTMTESVGLSGGKAIAKVLFAVIMLFMSITALNVAGVDTTLITSNILIVFGGVLIAFAIAYGFAARDILTNILSSYYGKDRFRPGMRVRIGNDEGVVEGVDSINITLRTADRLVLIPTSVLITERIEVLEDAGASEGGNIGKA